MGLKASHGTLIDASIVPVPIQRNKRDENNEIKGGSIPSEWKKKPSKLCQKDVDARWTKKNGKSYYGYKMPINADNKHLRSLFAKIQAKRFGQIVPITINVMFFLVDTGSIFIGKENEGYHYLNFSRL